MAKRSVVAHASIAAATSSGWPTRFSGVAAPALALKSAPRPGTKLRFDDARRDRQHAHFRRHHARERLTEDVEPGLRGDVGEVAAGARRRRDRRHVDDEPVAARLQQRMEGADGREHAAPVGGEDRIDQLVGESLEVVQRHGLGETRGIHQHVQHAGLFLHGLRRGGEARGIGDGGVHAEVPRPRQRGDERLRFRLGPPMQQSDASAQRG